MWYYYASLLNVVLRLSYDTYFGLNFCATGYQSVRCRRSHTGLLILHYASSEIAYAQDDNGDGVKVYQYDEGNSIIPKLVQELLLRASLIVEELYKSHC